MKIVSFMFISLFFCGCVPTRWYISFDNGYRERIVKPYYFNVNGNCASYEFKTKRGASITVDGFSYKGFSIAQAYEGNPNEAKDKIDIISNYTKPIGYILVNNKGTFFIPYCPEIKP